MKGQVADFSSDITKGCAPLVIHQFTDISSGNPTKWLWDFGNGNTSTQKNPGAIYFNPGSYTVKLTVTDASGKTSSVTKNNFIVVNSSATVNFFANDTVDCVPLNVEFTDKSSGVSGAITNWQWDFGDGTTSDQQNPSHNFTGAGDFSITLKVTNSFGCASVQTKPSYIRVNTLPKANFTSVSAVTCNPPVQVNFTNASTGGPIATSFWNFGDGTTSSSLNPSHLYSNAGTYQVTLSVTNRGGCTDSIAQATIIKSVTQSFSVPDTVCQGATTNFINTSSPAVAAAFWNFGDNTSSSIISPAKSYATAGSFIIKLINDFGRCKDSVTRKITVLSKPVADFTIAAPASLCHLPANVSFNSNAVAAVSSLWDFGDGLNSTITSPKHTYTSYGSYAVKLMVTGSNGCTDNMIKQNAVSLVPVKIQSFVNLPFNGCVPHQQNFSARIASPEAVATYFWDLGDGTTSATANPVRNYNTEGTYNVSLKVVTVNGCTDSFTLPAAIDIINKPVASFSATHRIACGNEKIQFTDLSTGKINFWKWEFGDGGIATIQNPPYRYYDTGFFSIKLIVGSLSCYDTAAITNYVYINPPIAKFSFQRDCAAPLAISFQNKSILAQTNVWDYGDGSPTSAAVNPAHTYALPGIYMVHLHVVNANCFDDITDTIQVINENADFAINKDTLCRNSTAVFTATNVNTQNVAFFSWDFGDATSPIAVTTATVAHAYASSGVFSPALTITDKVGCIKKISHTSPVSIFGPTAGFANPSGACLNSGVSFTDMSIPSANFPVTTWVFYYGDGFADTTKTPNFSHAYANAKKYDLSLTVTDSYGCKDTLSKQNAITITNSKALFSVSDSISCNNSTVSFINQSTGDSLSYFWSFGDGSTSAIAMPQHTFSMQGNYTISLTVKDTSGCVDSIKKANAVVIGNVKALIGSVDSVISCPPAQINFVNKSIYSAAVTWDFKDGNFANISNPSHYFLAVGTYHVKLTAYGYGVCIDSAFKDIIVNGPGGSFTYTPLSNCLPTTVNFKETATNNTNNNLTWDFGDGTTISTFNSSISHTYNIPGKFLPKVLLIDTSLNCKVSIFGTDTITVKGALSYIKNIQNIYCDSASVQFFDSSMIKTDTIAGYTWTFGDGTKSNLKNPVHKFGSSGLYPVQLVVKTTGGCTDSSANTHVKIVQSPPVQITGPAVACISQPVIFSGSSNDTSAISWKWDFSNGNNYFTATPPVLAYTVAGTYPILTSVTNSSGCTTSKTNLLNVYPLPNVNAGADTAICLGSKITLRASGADSYTWKISTSLSCLSCANPVASPVDTSVYYVVTGTNVLGLCQRTDSVKVKVVQPFKLFGITTDTLCKGESINISVTGADNYNWSPAKGLSNPNIPNPVANPDTTTVYTVTGHDYLNCFTDVAYIPITVYPVPVFNIIDNNITLASGTSVILKTTSSADITRWHWFPATGLNCNNCAQPVATPTNTIIYKAVASNDGGCSAEDRITIYVLCSNSNLFMPNTFSPNNDGSNDIFFPRGKGISGVKSLQIFNRSGAVVFQKLNFSINDPSSGWNGTYNGQALTQDVFVYQIEVICDGNQVFTFKGDVTLIR